MESLDVEVAHVLQVKTKDHHLGLVVPSDLVLEHEEKKYLKLIGSHHWLCKLVCPEAHKKQKNLSLANLCHEGSLSSCCGWVPFERTGRRW